LTPPLLLFLESCEQIWDPQEAEGKGANEFIKDFVPYNKKEQMLAELQGVEYSLEIIDEKLITVEPMDGSNWTKEDKEKFHAEIFRLRKDMKAISKATNKSMKSCLAYYLGTFKKSDNYRLLKTICVEERREKTAAASVHGFDACAICGDGGSLLICDGCEGEYHMGCLRPPLKSVPEGNWECDECVDRKLLEARDVIIRYSSLYERVDSKRKRRGADSQEEETARQESDSKEIVFRPCSPVLKVMKTLASGVNFSLCRTSKLSTKE
jgi:hypothetical protein